MKTKLCRTFCGLNDLEFPRTKAFMYCLHPFIPLRGGCFLSSMGNQYIEKSSKTLKAEELFPGIVAGVVRGGRLNT